MTPIDFETAVEKLDCTADIWRRLVEFVVAGCRVKRIVYHHLPPAGAPDAHLLRLENEGFEEALLAQYLRARAQGYAVLAAAAQRSLGPVYLEDLEGCPSLRECERGHLSGYRAAGVGNALALQVFGPGGRNGLFGVELEPDTARLSAEALARLHRACQVMHLQYCTVLLRTLGERPSLSLRELEILNWLARGKTNASIGEILGISGHTVEAHLRRIYLKLDVCDRVSAALRGLGFGLIATDACIA
jgi:DNA-binding CsgD family transcriptional regulator